MGRWLVCIFLACLGQGAAAAVLYCTFEHSHLTGHVFPQAMQLHLGPGPRQVVAHVRLEDGVGQMPGEIVKSTRYRQVFVFHVDGLRDQDSMKHRITYRLTYRRGAQTVTAEAKPHRTKQKFRSEGSCVQG